MATGTTGRGIAMEAIRIFGLPDTISLRAHVAGKGWLSYVGAGKTVGTTGQSRRLEAIQFKDVSPYTIMGRAHIQNKGWTKIIDLSESTVLGTTGKALQMEAIQLSIALPLDMIESLVCDASEVQVLRAVIGRSESSTAKSHREYLKKAVLCMASLGGAGAACAYTMGFGCAVAGVPAVIACAEAVTAGVKFLTNESSDAERERAERENLRRDIDAIPISGPGDGTTDLPSHGNIA